MSDMNQLDLTELSADLVAAYVSNNRLSPHELPGLLAGVYVAFASLTNGAAEPDEPPAVERLTPAQIRKSITPDALMSFVDGKPYKTLKRHLERHRLSFADYRARYGLPADYPTVAANYSAARSALAKSLGLGSRGYLVDKAAAAEATPEAAPKKLKGAARLRKAAEPA